MKLSQVMHKLYHKYWEYADEGNWVKAEEIYREGLYKTRGNDVQRKRWIANIGMLRDEYHG